MNGTDAKTQDNILLAGKREFLDKGYMGSSLRRIVKDAGVTTGAFYGYYKNKEALFDALVREPKEAFLACFNGAQEDFAGLPTDKQMTQMAEFSGQYIFDLLDQVYDHPDAFKLLLCSAEGTKHENFVNTLVEIEVAATDRFVDVLRAAGHSLNVIDAQLEHMLVSGMFSAFFETIIHDMPKAQAVRYVGELREFYTAGWQKIMGL